MTTLAGLWLTAAVLRQTELRRHHLAISRERQGDMPRDDIEVVRAAMGRAVRSLFAADVDVRKVTEFVANLRQRHGSKTPDVLEIEALIRSELGESAVAVDDIPATTVLAAGMLVLSEVVDQTSMSEYQVSRLVAAAERDAVERGWRPLIVLDQQ